MIWTILILVLAIALFAGNELLFQKVGKKDTQTIYWGKKGVMLLSIAFLVIGINRMGLGVSHYLVRSNPMILQEMIEAAQRQPQQAVSRREVRRILREQGDRMTQFAPIKGNPDAKHTIFMFTVPTCPACIHAHRELNRVIEDRDDVRVVIKAWSIHGPRSDAAVRAMIAAKLQSNDKAVALSDYFHGNRDWLEAAGRATTPEEMVKAIEKGVMDAAREVGLDVAQLENDMRGSAVRQEANQIRELVERLDVRGVPFIIIGDRAFPGAMPYDDIINALK
ncbi:MAG: thioredoxin domain-containing protein [Alphaproteobacteria bacterium]|nr:thioredoxin domain-containing protein [Alphaproteobacteria bacterium]